MTLKSHGQGTEEPLCREVIHNDTLANGYCDFALSVWIRVQSKIQNQLFRSTRDPAEVGITGSHC